MAGHVRYQAADRVATITLDHPPVNAFTGTMREDLLSCLERAGADETVRCVVVTGEGRAFCGGGDIADMVQKQAQADLAAIEHRMIVAARIVALIRALPKPVIAAVNGAAAGAGMNLALACDIRYASARAKFVQSFVKIGLVPDWGGHHLLTRLLGTAAALEIALLGEAIDGDRAYRLGIVNAVMPDATFADTVRSRVAAFAAGPPRAMAAIKRGIYFSTEHNLAETLGYEVDAQRAAFQSAEAREGLRAFLDKRPPKF